MTIYPAAPDLQQVEALKAALEDKESIVTTGLILQELLQGFSGARAHNEIVKRFAALPIITPARQDHIDAAELRNRLRRSGLHMGTMDSLLAHLCIRHNLVLLSTDKDFNLAARHGPLRLWKAAPK